MGRRSSRRRSRRSRPRVYGSQADSPPRRKRTHSTPPTPVDLSNKEGAIKDVERILGVQETWDIEDTTLLMDVIKFKLYPNGIPAAEMMRYADSLRSRSDTAALSRLYSML
mgnify:CR=1 FL=1